MADMAIRIWRSPPTAIISPGGAATAVTRLRLSLRGGVDRLGKVYAADTYNGRVQKFTCEATSPPGQFRPWKWRVWPHGLTLTALGLCITDSDHNLVLVFPILIQLPVPS
jgi:hypothetical protein